MSTFVFEEDTPWFNDLFITNGGLLALISIVITLFIVLRMLFYAMVTRLLPSTLSYDSRMHWTLRTFSAIQAIIATAVGICIVTDPACAIDVIHGHSKQHWGYRYGVLSLAYYIYDIIAMYETAAATATSMDMLYSMRLFMKHKGSLIAHHVFIMILCTPVMFVGLGEFFIGVFLLTEASTPLLHLRWMFQQYNMQETSLYLLLSVVVMMTFFAVRIVLIPYAFVLYARYASLTLWEAVLHVPRICRFSTAIIYSFSVYWFGLMCRNAMRLQRRRQQRRD